MQWLKRFQLLELNLELTQDRFGKLCAVFERDPKEASSVFDLWWVVEQQLLVEVRVLVLLHKVRHQPVELFRWALVVHGPPQLHIHAGQYAWARLWNIDSLSDVTPDSPFEVWLLRWQGMHMRLGFPRPR